jgi:predicted nucleotidyltransferase
MPSFNTQELSEKAKKRNSLRAGLGLPIGSILFAAPQFADYSGGEATDEGLGLNDGSSINEMIHIAKDLQNTIKKSGKDYEVYDIEEAGIPLYTAQFEPNMHDKEVSTFPNNEGKKYICHVKNPTTGKIIQLEYSNPDLKIEEPKEKKTRTPKKEKGKVLPRHWSAKYWSVTPVKNILAEIINPDEIDVSVLKFNDELNPLLWDGENKLKDDVRNRLLKIAVEFIKSCKIEDYTYNDIVLVGSMANFTYTPQSDIDIHIVVDFSQFKADETILGEYFDAKKDLWSNAHDIKINGHNVECYVQNSQEPYTSLGVYSLMKKDWIREPIKKMVSVDEGNIQVKAAAFMNAIDKLEERFKNGEDVALELKKIKDKIKNMRKNGLYKEGEYSTENLVFKVLRNSGYLEKVINLKNNNMDQNLSS